MTIDMNDDVPFGGSPPQDIQPFAQRSDIVEIEQSRAEQETQAGFLVAKKYPRHEQAAMERILRSCKRKTLAEQAEYAFPRGGQQVTGPTIRLAEVIAQSWGNMAFGIRELQSGAGISMMMAYCYDLETNTRAERIFSVKHERKARGQTTQLTDARDIYEMTANQGSRRLRACILQVIPGDVTELAVEACRGTMELDEGNIKERIPAMLEEFAKIGVTKEMIEAKFEKNAEALLAADLVVLRRIFMSLRDGMSNTGQWFPQDTAEKLKQKLDETKAPPKAKKKRRTKAEMAAARAAEAAEAAAAEGYGAEPEPPPEPEAPPETEPEPPEPAPEPKKNPFLTEEHVIARTSFTPKGGKISAWQTQMEERTARGIESLTVLNDENPRLSMAKCILELLAVFKVTDIEELKPEDRMEFRDTLDQVLDGFDEATENKEE